MCSKSPELGRLNPLCYFVSFPMVSREASLCTFLLSCPYSIRLALVSMSSLFTHPMTTSSFFLSLPHGTFPRP